MSFLKGAKNITVTGGTQIAVGVVNINRGEQPALSPASRELSAAAAHTALHNSASRYDAPRCYKNTRAKQLGKLERWMLSLDDHDKDIIWLCGGAGAGKSAVMQTIVERCFPHGVVLGSFFFSRSDPSRNYAEVLIPTLAYQVARAFPAAMTILEPIIIHDPLIFNASLRTQAYELLVRPILHLIENGVIGDTAGSCGVFVIDGLDECNNPKKQALIIDAVASILIEHSLPVLFLISSRPEPVINDQFHRQFNHRTNFTMLLLDEDGDAESDIRHFIEDSFLDILEFHPLRDHIQQPWPPAFSIQQLVYKSSGYFIYAATAMRFVASYDEHPVRALKVIEGLEPARSGNPFGELDSLYRHILISARYHTQVVNILRCHFFAGLGPSVPAVCRILDITPDDVHLFLSDVQALLSISPDRYHFNHLTIRPKHASLRDFLLDEARSQTLHISNEVYQASLLTRFFDQLLPTDANVRMLRPSFLWSTSLEWNAFGRLSGGNNLITALCRAIKYSDEIDILDLEIRRHSPRNIWNFCEENDEYPSTDKNTEYPSIDTHAISVSYYMSAIRDSVANEDNSLYLLHFPTYIQGLLEIVAAVQRPTTHDHIVPAFLFSSSRWALQIIQPLFFNLFKQLRIDMVHAYYLLHLADYYHLGANPLTWEGLKQMPQRNISWGADLATGMTFILEVLLRRSRRPPLHFFNCHEQWLKTRKPAKSAAIGSPRLSTRFYGCRRGWPKFNYDHAYDYTSSFISGTNRLAARGHLWDKGFRCILLLKAVIFFLRKADCTAELAKLARKALPRHTLWFPKLMKKARREMDAYVLRWEESTEAFFERAQSLVINDLD